MTGSSTAAMFVAVVVGGGAAAAGGVSFVCVCGVSRKWVLRRMPGDETAKVAPGGAQSDPWSTELVVSEERRRSWLLGSALPCACACVLV